MLNEFKFICDFRKKLNAQNGVIKSNDKLIEPLKKVLSLFEEKLISKYEDYRNTKFQVKVSTGIGNFPKVIHICILPPKQKVSNGIYVAICFDILGRGALVGCAESVTNPQGLDTKKRLMPRKSKETLRINVDGGKRDTNYNNCYVNPKEFIVDNFSEIEFYKHIEVSLNIALYQLDIVDASQINREDIVNKLAINQDFNPNDIQDSRNRISAQIAQRRGQKKFRDSLLEAYEYKCAITSCNLVQVLEAAHIHPYKGDETNHVQNGILLRTDIHTLFDLGYITIDHKTKRIIVHNSLSDTTYYKYNGKMINLPSSKKNYPNDLVLKFHNENEFKS